MRLSTHHHGGAGYRDIPVQCTQSACERWFCYNMMVMVVWVITTGLGIGVGMMMAGVGICISTWDGVGNGNIGGINH